MKTILSLLLITTLSFGQTLTGHASYSGHATAGNVSGGAGASHLARSFNGSSDFLQSASTVPLSSPNVITLGFRMYWNAFANDDQIAFESSANFNNTIGAILVDPDESGSGAFYFGANTQGDATGKLSCTFTRPSAATWHTYLLVINISANPGTCAAYVDGSSQSVSASQNGNYTITTFTDQTLNVMSRNGASLFAAGRISDIVIWGADESANASTLSNCSTSPASVDAGHQAAYWPIKQVSPETPTTGAVNLTVTGTTNIASPC